MRPLPAALVTLLLVSCSAPSDSPVARPLPGAVVGTAFDPRRDRGMDPLMIRAAARGDLPAVRRAHVRGASVRARDGEGRTALIAAAYGNHVRVARFLIAAGADVNATDSTRQSAYLIATSEVGDDPRLLTEALRNGARVNAKDSFNGTGLIRAAERGHPRIVRRLLAEGIQIDHVNRLGWTALHEAIILGDGSARYQRVVRLLVRAGADVRVRSARDGLLPVEHAQRRGFAAIEEILLTARG